MRDEIIEILEMISPGISVENNNLNLVEYLESMEMIEFIEELENNFVSKISKQKIIDGMQLYCMNRADNGELNEKNGIDRSLSFWIGSSIKKRDTGSGI